MKTYEHHMEDEYILTVLKEIEERDKISITGELKKYYMFLIIEMVKVFIDKNPDYFFDEQTDYHACLQIAYNIASLKKWSKADVTNGKMNEALDSWKVIVEFVKSDNWLRTRSLSDLSTVKEFQRIVQKMGEKSVQNSGKKMHY